MSNTPEVLAGRVTDLHGGDAATVVELVTAMAHSYTRGEGFTDGQPASDIAAVVVMAATRLLAHPDQLAVAQTMGAFSVDYSRGGFQGFTVAERIVLDRYRVKAL